MSRIANKPITLPKGAEFKQTDTHFEVKGAKGSLSLVRPSGIAATIDGDQIQLATEDAGKTALMGTIRTLVFNMITGVTEGFERKLELKGVGFRATLDGTALNLSLGFSHPVVFPAPEGITLEAPAQNQIVVKGIDKQKVGQVAAKIRALRPPEPYKGKGVRYEGEHVILKEAKKA